MIHAQSLPLGYDTPLSCLGQVRLLRASPLVLPPMC